MPAELDLLAVRRFTDELNNRLRQCDSGEGMICSNLDESINHHVQLCQELRECVNQWAHAVFAGQLERDPAVENLLTEETRHLLDRAEQLAALGRAMNGQCFELEGLNALHWYIADFDYLLENWVSPQLAVSPAPRMKLPDAVVREAIERLEKLPPLPSNWQPTNPEQFAFFQRQRAV